MCVHARLELMMGGASFGRFEDGSVHVVCRTWWPRGIASHLLNLLTGRPLKVNKTDLADLDIITGLLLHF